MSTLIERLDAAGLTGRGGAAFSTATKLRAAQADDAHLLVNACDGERGAAKDAWVVAHRLDELRGGVALVTGGTVRATCAAHRGSETAARLRAAGLAVLDVPHRYVSSEESALLSLLHGGLAKPMTKVVPFVHGGRDSAGRRIRPTVVLNAETLWRVAQVESRGIDWFRSFGTAAEPGPRLVSVTGSVDRPGVLETAAGVPLREILDAAGGLAADASAVLIGGIGGVVLNADAARRATWSREGMAEFGGTTGPGVVEVLDPARCPLHVVGELIAFGAGESAGQCGPCMFGLPAIARDWTELVARPAEATLRRLRTRLGVVPGRGACRHPDGVSRLAASALHSLSGHLAEHSAGRCPARSRHDVAV
jgi:NADH:ubiquinone oxidoreductase subunit F (NADH-binding)